MDGIEALQPLTRHVDGNPIVRPSGLERVDRRLQRSLRGDHRHAVSALQGEHLRKAVFSDQHPPLQNPRSEQTNNFEGLQLAIIARQREAIPHAAEF